MTAAKPILQTPMKLYDTLADMLEEGRSKDRHVLLINGEKDESRISFAELSERAHLLLGSMQQRGMLPGDEVVVFTKSNESFLVAFWAAILGGIVPVPVAVGISDEHRFKLFKILDQHRFEKKYGLPPDDVDRSQAFLCSIDADGNNNAGERLRYQHLVPARQAPAAIGSTGQRNEGRARNP